MSLVQLITKYPHLCYPFISKDNSYFRSLSNKLNEYEEFVSEYLKTPSTILSEDDHRKIIILNQTILESIKTYLEGFNGKAYYSLEKVLLSMKNEISELELLLDNNTILYRLRTSSDNSLKREEIFHIPFDRRFLVSNQRYSIAGLPCLYLGYRVYNCWKEIGYPSFNRTWAASFQPLNSIVILNFALDLNTIASNSRNWTADKIRAMLILYPLIIASGFKVLKIDAAFHEEYIIPNMILQFITHEKQILGIQYFSTKNHSYCEGYSDHFTNVVIPTKCKFQEFGLDIELRESFSISTPQHLFLLSQLPNAGDVVAYANLGELNDMDQAIYENYEYTSFNNIEKHLLSRIKID